MVMENMNNSTNIVEILSTLAIILVAIAGIMKSAIEISKIIPDISKSFKESRLKKAVLKGLVSVLLFLSLAIPNGLFVWFMVFQIGKNPRQILEPAIFFLVILQITILVSIYSFIWGFWLVPFLRKPSDKQENPKG